MSEKMSKSEEEMSKVLEGIAERDPKLMDDFLEYIEQKYGSVTPENLGKEMNIVMLIYLAFHKVGDYPEIYKQKVENGEI